MWAAVLSYVDACRDVLGLKLPEFEKYQAWEDCALHGGFRVLHPEFCIVSDFPEVIKIDEENRPHCEDGCSHRWRDGWSLYHWHGVAVPEAWIMDKASLTAKVALSEQNLELRRAAVAIVGWDRIISELGGRVVDDDGDPQIGTLIEVQLPHLPAPSRFVKVQCGTGRSFAVCVPLDTESALAGQAWMAGKPLTDFTLPEVRS